MANAIRNLWSASTKTAMANSATMKRRPRKKLAPKVDHVKAARAAKHVAVIGVPAKDAVATRGDAKVVPVVNAVATSVAVKVEADLATAKLDVVLADQMVLHAVKDVVDPVVLAAQVNAADADPAVDLA
jgi:hypothetical protein